LVANDRDNAIDGQGRRHALRGRGWCLRSDPKWRERGGNDKSLDHRKSYPATESWFDHFLPPEEVEDAVGGAGTG
jgi:hypothetical protein